MVGVDRLDVCRDLRNPVSDSGGGAGSASRAAVVMMSAQSNFED